MYKIDAYIGSYIHGLNMSNSVNLTAQRVANFVPQIDKQQSFLWDLKMRGLGVRSTPKGKPSYIFQGRYQMQTIRVVIGSTGVWNIPQAREKAREIQREIDQGRDPRLVLNERKAKAKVVRQHKKKHSITIGELWDDYVAERKADWSQHTHRDHQKAMQEGGVVRKRWKGKKTKPGALAGMRNICIGDLSEQVVERVAAIETKKRPTQFRLALRMFRAFLRWAVEERGLTIEPTIARTRKLTRLVGKTVPKSDHLLKNQLASWFKEVTAIENSVISAYLQCLLITGARRNELLNLKWSDIDWKSSYITLHDKVDEFRPVPLSPYVRSLISVLPRENCWVFSSLTSKSGRLVEPSIAHRKACLAAGLQLTLHGLRRSFKSLTEWSEIPVGVVSQIMGHKPSATAEKHYTVRPVDLLLLHHEKIEAW
ncbi:MAG: preprotein translocase, partial [Gammaproteobacteria bacterium]|nr:preprotein translocase [Gammaproteobacteria bacterium]